LHWAGAWVEASVITAFRHVRRRVGLYDMIQEWIGTRKLSARRLCKEIGATDVPEWPGPFGVGPRRTSALANWLATQTFSVGAPESVLQLTFSFANSPAPLRVKKKKALLRPCSLQRQVVPILLATQAVEALQAALRKQSTCCDNSTAISTSFNPAISVLAFEAAVRSSTTPPLHLPYAPNAPRSWARKLIRASDSAFSVEFIISFPTSPDVDRSPGRHKPAAGPQAGRMEDEERSLKAKSADVKTEEVVNVNGLTIKRESEDSPPLRNGSKASPASTGASPEEVNTQSNGASTPDASSVPKPSRKASQKALARAPLLFDHVTDSTEDACSHFQVINDCLYGSKHMGSSEHDALDCDCSEEWRE
jgi:hypothetical protein